MADVNGFALDIIFYMLLVNVKKKQEWKMGTPMLSRPSWMDCGSS